MEEVSTVNILKLISGEELIAEVLGNDMQIWKLRNVYQLYPTDKGTFVMAPFLPLVKGVEIKIKDSHVLACELAEPKTTEQYIRSLNPSDLYVPPAPSTKIVF